MFFTLKEIVRWLGVTVFELWLYMLGLLIFSVLLVLKLEPYFDYNWWIVFSPLFIVDGFNCYFCFIVVLRMYLARHYKGAPLRALWSFVVLGMSFVFKFLLCLKLEVNVVLESTEVTAPIFTILQLFMIRACQMH